MTLPEHRDPISTNRRGQAPYNFVPLPEAILHAGEAFEQHDRLDSDRLHGRIDLRISTETELYTRAAYPPAEEPNAVCDSRPRQDFYHHGDPRHPVIPGASLRGMVRALVQILSYSRISRRAARDDHRLTALRDEALVYRAVADQTTPTGAAYNARFLGKRGRLDFDYPSTRVRGGYLEQDPRGAWRIRPAHRIEGASFVRINLRDLARNGFPTMDKHGEAIANRVLPVWVRPEPVRAHRHRRVALHYARTDRISRDKADGLVPGSLIYAGAMGTRHMHTVIYAPDRGAQPIPIDEGIWEQYREDRDQQRGIPCRKIGKAGDPLFYLLAENGQDLEFMGPTLFFRVPYPYRTGNFVPEACIDGDGPLDLTEAIFGTVDGLPADDRSEAGVLRGRVAFDDATQAPSTPDASPFLEGRDGYRIPSVLSAPKPTSYQNYLVQTDPEGDKGRLLSYAAKTPDSGSRAATALRGFKQYWHRGRADQPAPAATEPGERDLHLDPPTEHKDQYTWIRPVRPGVVFTGRIRFENLLPEELGALLAALELPSGCRHRLGMGKPLGLGSVRIEAETTLIDPRERYRSLSDTGKLEPAEARPKLDAARDAFRRRVIHHHNRQVPETAVPETAELWDIPRLASLKTLLDWEHRPPRAHTAYLRDPHRQDLKEFRQRRVLPTPAAVVATAQQAGPAVPRARPVRRPAPNDMESIPSTPALRELHALLQDKNWSQRQRLDAIDDTMLHRLGGLDAAERRQAWRMIAGTIGVNRKTRERLRAIEQQLLGGPA